MSATDAIREFPATRRRLWLACFVLVALIVIAAAWAVWDRREDVSASYRRDMTNLSIVLAEQAARSMQAVDLVLQESQKEVLAAGIGDAEQFRRSIATDKVHRFLHFRAKNLPQADTIGLVDAKGTLVNGSRHWPAPALDLSERDYYVHFRDHDDGSVFLSRPARAKLGGDWTFYLARRLSGPHGEFLGVVVAGINAAYFEDFYRAIALQHDGAVAIFREDGLLLARYPRVEVMIGKKLAPQSAWYQRVREGGGSYRSPGYIDGIARLISVKPLRDYPLVVGVTIAEDAALADWRRQAASTGVGALGIAIGITALFGALAARSRQSERDTTALAEAAEALRESEARFRDFASISSDWFWETDENHRYASVVGAHQFGLNAGVRLGRVRTDFAADLNTEPEKWREHLALLDRHEPFRDFVYARRVGDEPERMVSVSGTPLFDAAGEFLGYRGTARDVTEDCLAERRLHEAKIAAEAANRAKSQFLTNMSHELRTPLNAILGYSEMLALGLAGPLERQQKEKLQIIHQSGDHLLSIINDILDLAKIDAGKFELNEQNDIEPRQIIEGCVALVRERAREGGLRLVVENGPTLPCIIADATRLKQILLNLLSNAVKFTPPGGSIVVAAENRGEAGLAFKVQDTGAGMTADEIKVALEAFGQVDGGLTRQHEGTGLGLPLVRRLTELHGGSLQIDSQKGRGTSVSVILPASRVMAATTAASAAA